MLSVDTSLLVSVLPGAMQWVTVHIDTDACIAACGDESMAEACSYTDLSGSDGEHL